MSNPTKYKPTEANEFVGKARTVARLTLRRVDQVEGDDPVKFLFYGPPGTGKSRLATVLANRMSDGQVCNIHLINGQSLTIDVVRKWQDEGHYKSILGGRTVKIVEEVDAASNAAMNELRTWLDNIKNGTAFIATTNKKLDDIQEQLSSRCHPYDFGGLPPVIQLTELLVKYAIPYSISEQIARGCGHNVRAALFDAEQWLDAEAINAEDNQ